MLEALRHSGEAGHSNEPPAGVEAAVPPQLAGRDIRELGARRKTPGLVEELEYEEILSGPQEDLEGLAVAALREFKRLHCSKYPVCEKLMRKNRWISAERNLQELEEGGNRVMEGHGDRLSVDGNRGLGAKLAKYHLQVMSCNWKRGPPDISE